MPPLFILISHAQNLAERGITKTEITDAVIERMYAFWHFHANNNKDILHRHTNTEASDHFTETCLLFIKTYFEQQDRGLKVESEKNILSGSGRKPVKPDISIWQDGKLVAVIELKVSNGWKGSGIDVHLEKRRQQIQNACPQAWFGVLAFWNFGNPNTSQWGSTYFGLLDHKKDYKHIQTDVCIEHLLEQIDQHINNL